MTDYIEAPVEYRLCVLALLIKSDWLDRYGTVLRPEHMPSKEEQSFVSWINRYYDKYRKIPDAVIVQHGLIGNSIVRDVLAVSDDSNLEYVADTAIEYVKTQALKLAVLQSATDISKGDSSNLRKYIDEALLVGSDRLELGSDLVDNVDDWVYDELHGRRFPTGWSWIDKVLDGGIVAGEYWVMLAAPGKGKTTALVNIGYSMAGLLGAANVLHLTYEVPKTKVLKRYAARVTGTRLSRSDYAGDMQEKVFKRQLQTLAKQRLRGRLRVIYPSSRKISDIYRIMDNLESSGFHTDALIIDYPSLLDPPRRRNERRFELADISRDVRQIGCDRGIPIWGAAQAGRQALSKEVVTLHDIAEAIEIAAIADGVLAICQTRDEQKLGLGRLFGAKIRDAEDSFFVPVKIDLKSQSMIQKII